MSNDVTFFERQKLQYLLRTKLSMRAIAKIMRRNHTIVIREVKRNGGSREKYRADNAQKQYEKRKHKKHIGKLEKHNDLRKYVEEKISHDWSPEQIAGRLKEHSPKSLNGLTISHESIYYWIYEKSLDI
jgi:transposase, IS30 family